MSLRGMIMPLLMKGSVTGGCFLVFLELYGLEIWSYLTGEGNLIYTAWSSCLPNLFDLVRGSGQLCFHSLNMADAKKTV